MSTSAPRLTLALSLSLLGLLAACGGESPAPGGDLPECRLNSDCPAGQRCMDEACVPDESANNATNSGTNNANNQGCTGEDCPCRSDGDCGRSEYCEVATGECLELECLEDADCALGSRCEQGHCSVDVGADRDRDGVPDNSPDNCPDLANPAQTDTDTDGMGDACDVDDDDDGVLDEADNCPLLPNPSQANADGDAMGNRCDEDVRGTSIAGRLDGSSLPGADPLLARVYLVGRDTPAVVDNQRRFAFDQALAEGGPFTLMVQWPGFVPWTGSFTAPDDQPVYDVDVIVLERQVDPDQTRALSGYARYADQDTHAGITARLLLGGQTYATATTDADGLYTLQASPESAYTLMVEAEGYRPVNPIGPITWSEVLSAFVVDGVPLEQRLAIVLERGVGQITVDLAVQQGWIPIAQRRFTLHLVGQGLDLEIPTTGAQHVLPALTLGGYEVEVHREGFATDSASVMLVNAAPQARITLDLDLIHLADAQSGGIDLSGLTLSDAEVGAIPDLTGADLSVLGEIEAEAAGEGVALCGLDLSAADLSGLDLHNDTEGVDLAQTLLVDAVLVGTDLSGANLAGADLSGADLTGALVLGARWISGEGCGEALEPPASARLVGAVLHEVVFGDAELAGVDLSGADLSSADLTDARTAGLAGDCPMALPPGFTCRAQPATAGVVLLGPGVDLSGADLGGADLSGADLSGADLSGADLGDADLTGTRIGALSACPSVLPLRFVCRAQPATGGFVLLGPGVYLGGAPLDGVDMVGAELTDADLSSATLTDARTWGLLGGCPASLPDAAFSCRLQPTPGTHALLGPGVDLAAADLSGADLSGVDLSGADLSDANLSGADLSGARPHGLQGACPAELPASFTCSPQPNGPGLVLLGPGVDLSGVDLRGVSLEGAALTGARLSQARTFDMTGTCPAVDNLPTGFRCVAQASALLALVGPEADLAGADLHDAALAGTDLRGATLQGADLTGADLTGAHTHSLSGTCPAALPNASFVCRNQPAAGGLVVLLGPGVNLSGANLDALELSGINLNGADLSGATLTGATLALTQTDALVGTCPASLPSADFVCRPQPTPMRHALLGPGLDLAGADLSSADLRDVNLTGTILQDANLTNANLGDGPDANTLGANLTNADLSDGPDADTLGANLTNADLRGATLAMANLRSVTLTGAHTHSLSGACPTTLPSTSFICRNQPTPGLVVIAGPRVNLSAANLASINLFSVNLIEATLVGTNLINADLREADFDNANMEDVDLTGANLENADLSGANLVNAELDNAILRNADLEGADLEDADLADADLRDADLYDATLRNADFRNANLTNADLRDSSLSDANLRGANLTNANLGDGPDSGSAGATLTGATLTGATLTGAILTNVGWNDTTCPDGTNSDTNGDTCVGHL